MNMYQKAYKSAQEQLEKLCITDPPVDTTEIAEELDLSITEMIMPDKLKDVAGYIDFENDEIVVNKKDPKTKKNFTIAHEIGHYLLHKDALEQTPGLYKALLRTDQYDGDDIMEKEANAFASELLAPKYLLEKYHFLPVDIKAKLFGVSPKLISQRTKQ